MDVLKKSGTLILLMSLFVFNSVMAAPPTNFQAPKCVWVKPNIECSIPLIDVASNMDVLKKNKSGNLILSMSLFVSNSVKGTQTASYKPPTIFQAPTSYQAPTNLPTFKSVWAESYALEQQKKYAAAANVIGPILNTSPRNELALIRLGWLNYLQAKYNVSEDYYHKALDVNNDSIDARLGLTLPLLAEQRWKEAAIYANQVISMCDWNYYGHIRLMTCESGLAQWETLEKHASEFIKRYPSDADGFLFLARSQAMLGKNDQAIQNYQETLFRSPTNAEAIKYLEKKK